MIKTCSKCKKRKQLKSFHKNQYNCIICKKEYAFENRERKKIRDVKYYKEHLSPMRSTVHGRMKNLVSSVRFRAKNTQFVFDITTQKLTELLILQNFSCKQTGVVFDLSLGHGSKRLLRAPSVDRIDPSKGYVLDNIQLVCLFYNMAKNNSTDEDLWSLMIESVKNRGDQ